MSHAWHQTIDINEEIASKFITSQHNMHIQSIQALDAGWDNVVYLINNDLVFRFPRREFGLTCMENEIIFLPIIKQHVSFPLSAPEWIGKPSPLYPYPYAGYKILSGKALSDQEPQLIHDKQFAKTIAHWLKELHQIPIKPAYIETMEGEYEWKVNVEHRTHLCKVNIAQYEKFYVDAGLDLKCLLQIISHLEKWNFLPQKRCFVHGDLYSRHIIVNEKMQPTGIIDWGDIHIGHPGIDLAVGMIFTQETFHTFLASYGEIDEETYRITLFHSFCHSMSFLPYAFEQNKNNLMKWATIVLQRVIDEIGENNK